MCGHPKVDCGIDEAWVVVGVGVGKPAKDNRCYRKRQYPHKKRAEMNTI